jgi:hypothetical protein
MYYTKIRSLAIKRESVWPKGIVVSGEYSGWEILIADDRDGGTGGYYIFLKKSDAERFDSWCENEAGLQAQLADFEVRWMD